MREGFAPAGIELSDLQADGMAQDYMRLYSGNNRHSEFDRRIRTGRLWRCGDLSPLWIPLVPSPDAVGERRVTRSTQEKRKDSGDTSPHSTGRGSLLPSGTAAPTRPTSVSRPAQAEGLSCPVPDRSLVTEPAQRNVQEAGPKS